MIIFFFLIPLNLISFSHEYHLCNNNLILNYSLCKNLSELINKTFPQSYSFNKKKNTYQWKRRDGSIISIQKNSIKEFTNNTQKFISWKYSKNNKSDEEIIYWNVIGNCQTYQVNWDRDNIGWLNVNSYKKLKNSKKLIGRCNKKQEFLWYFAAREAKDILDNYCK